MANDLIRRMQSLFPGLADVHEAFWRPAADIHRTRAGWLVKMDLAGVRPQDVSITVQGQRLTVSGVRKDWSVGEGCSCYVMEITYSRFERTFTIPANLEHARITAEQHEGMLHIRIETEEAQS